MGAVLRIRVMVAGWAFVVSAAGHALLPAAVRSAGPDRPSFAVQYLLALGVLTFLLVLSAARRVVVALAVAGAAVAASWVMLGDPRLLRGWEATGAVGIAAALAALVISGAAVRGAPSSSPREGSKPSASPESPARPAGFPTVSELFDEAVTRALTYTATFPDIGMPIEELRPELAQAARSHRETLLADAVGETSAYDDAVSALMALRPGRRLPVPAAMRARPARRSPRVRLVTAIVALAVAVILAMWSVYAAGSDLFGGATWGWVTLGVVVIGGVALTVVSVTLGDAHLTVGAWATGLLAGLLLAAVPYAALGVTSYRLGRAAGPAAGWCVVLAIAIPLLDLALLIAGVVILIDLSDRKTTSRAGAGGGPSVGAIPAEVAVHSDAASHAVEKEQLSRAADAALEVLRRALIDRVVLGFFRDEINRRQHDEYGTLLRGGDWQGLWSAGMDRHVPTEAETRLATVTDRLALPGGSVGIYGPRGAGKTHLINIFCERHRTDVDLSVKLSAPVDYLAREFLLQVDAELCDAVLARTGNPTPDAVRAPWSLLRRPRPAPESLGRGLSRIGYQVREHRAGLFHLATVTDTFGGRVGAQVAEVSGSRGLQRAEQPRGYAEVVANVRKLLGMIVRALREESGGGDRHPRVVIAIDDLDRIETPERARAFLNEIKAMFGVPGVVFLVSMSDEAMAEFDVGGTFQATFDNAFDALIRVDRLEWSAAKKILVGRTLGMSEPFRLLAYCLAGGPARGLVRVAREVAAIDDERVRQGAAPVRLAAVTARLVGSQISLLARRLRVRLAPHEGRPAVADAVIALDDIERQRLAPVVVQGLMDALAPVARDAELQPTVHAALTRLYLLLTLLQVFTNEIDVRVLVRASQEPAGTTPFDELATAAADTSGGSLPGWLAVDRARTQLGIESFGASYLLQPAVMTAPSVAAEPVAAQPVGAQPVG